MEAYINSSIDVNGTSGKSFLDGPKSPPTADYELYVNNNATTSSTSNNEAVISSPPVETSDSDNQQTKKEKVVILWIKLLVYLFVLILHL